MPTTFLRSPSWQLPRLCLTPKAALVRRPCPPPRLPAASFPGTPLPASRWFGGGGTGRAKAFKCIPGGRGCRRLRQAGYFGGRPLNENRAGMLEAEHGVPEGWVRPRSWAERRRGGRRRARAGERDRLAVTAEGETWPRRPPTTQGHVTPIPGWPCSPVPHLLFLSVKGDPTGGGAGRRADGVLGAGPRCCPLCWRESLATSCASSRHRPRSGEVKMEAPSEQHSTEGETEARAWRAFARPGVPCFPAPALWVWDRSASLCPVGWSHPEGLGPPSATSEEAVCF